MISGGLQAISCMSSHLTDFTVVSLSTLQSANNAASPSTALYNMTCLLGAWAPVDVAGITRAGVAFACPEAQSWSVGGGIIEVTALTDCAAIGQVKGQTWLEYVTPLGLQTITVLRSDGAGCATVQTGGPLLFFYSSYCTFFTAMELQEGCGATRKADGSGGRGEWGRRKGT